MNRPVILLACALAMSSAGSAHAVTGGEILDWCNGYPESPRPRLCEAYVEAAIDLIREGEMIDGMRACIPDAEPLAAQGLLTNQRTGRVLKEQGAFLYLRFL